MARNKNVKVNITGDSSGLEKATQRAGNSIDRFVGNAKKSLATVAAAVTGVVAAMRGFASSIQVISSFEAANSRLAAVLGTSTKNIKALTEAAMELGRRTQYTASEVTDLQTELAKLGFSQSEILAMQEPVLKFAAAVGTDLASAAARAGATMRGFGLTAEETGDMLAVMAVSTSKSALSFDYLDETLGKIVPVTKAFGLDTRATIALLGTLANAGIDASSSATALRTIITRLADSNSKLNGVIGKQPRTMQEVIDALADLRDRGIGVTEAMDLVGKYSGSTFLALVNGADSCRELYGELNNVDTALNDMYTTMTDNVEGAINRLKSAWEGFILSMRQSQGPIKTVINLLGDMVTEMTMMFSGEARNSRAKSQYSSILGGILERDGMDAVTDFVNKEIETLNAEIARKSGRQQQAMQFGWLGAWNVADAQDDINQLVSMLQGLKDAYAALQEQALSAGDAVVTVTSGEGGSGGAAGGGKKAGKAEIFDAATKQYLEDMRILREEEEDFAQRSQAAWDAIAHAPDPAVAAIMQFAEINLKSEKTAEEAWDDYVKAEEEAMQKSMALQERWKEQMADFGEGLSNALQGAFTDTFANLGEFIGGALSGGLDDAAANLGAGLLDTLGSLAIQVGELAISTGVAVAGIKTALESLNPYVAIAAGAALVALGSAVRSAAGNISKGSTSAYAVGTSSYSSYPSDGYSTRQLNIKVSGTLTAGAGVLNAVIDSENTRLEHTT